MSDYHNSLKTDYMDKTVKQNVNPIYIYLKHCEIGNILIKDDTQNNNEKYSVISMQALK